MVTSAAPHKPQEWRSPKQQPKDIPSEYFKPAYRVMRHENRLGQSPQGLRTGFSVSWGEHFSLFLSFTHSLALNLRFYSHCSLIPQKAITKINASNAAHFISFDVLLIILAHEVVRLSARAAVRLPTDLLRTSTRLVKKHTNKRSEPFVKTGWISYRRGNFTHYLLWDTNMCNKIRK